MSKRQFQGMIFDNGDILFDASVWRRWLHLELQAYNADLSFQDLVAHWETLLTDVYSGKADYWTRFVDLLEQLEVPLAAQNDLTVAAREKGLAVQTDRSPMPGVPETLAELQSRGVRLGVLSDTEGGESAVRSILQQLGIERFFDSVVASSDIRHAKPEPAAYEHAVKALGLTHDQCAFVAHDIDELTGAQKVGLFAIAYNDTPEAPRDATAGVFSDLLEYASS